MEKDLGIWTKTMGTISPAYIILQEPLVLEEWNQMGSLPTLALLVSKSLGVNPTEGCAGCRPGLRQPSSVMYSWTVYVL